MTTKAGASYPRRGFVRRRGNSFEVVVYAGVDPLTGKDRYLSRSTQDERQVDKIRTQLSINSGAPRPRRPSATSSMPG